MKKHTRWTMLIFCLAAVLGVVLHYLYGWLPNPITALISPVRESLWEHLKILFFPLLLAALWFAKGDREALAVRLLSLLAVCGLMLGIGYVYHVVFRGASVAFDVGLYLVLMAVGFVLPRMLWPLGEWPGVGGAAGFLTLLLAVLIIWFTFFPPDAILFADLSGGVRTFLTIPV